jgi:hypothetical protein
LIALDIISQGAGTVVFLPWSDGEELVEKKMPSLIRTWEHPPHELTCTEPGASWFFNATTLHWGRGNTSLIDYRIVMNVTLGSSVESTVTANRTDTDTEIRNKRRKRQATFTPRSNNRFGHSKKARRTNNMKI